MPAPLSGSTPGVALVVGGGSGIGRAIALRLSEGGLAIGVCGRRRGPLDDVVGAITARGGRGCVAPADVTDPEARRTAVAAIETALGPIDVLVVSTVGPPPEQASWLAWSDDDWRREVEVGALACFGLAQLISPAMSMRGFGRIVFVGSVLAGLGVDPFLYSTVDTPQGVSAVPYHAAKGAIVATARALACVLGSSGVTVNVVSPGMIDTVGVAALLPPETRLRIEQRTPAARLGTPEEVAAAAAFLASADAGFITGHELVVDGGWSAW